MTRCRKRVRIALIVFSCLLFSSKLFAQLTIGAVDVGPYTPGSTIAATFSINPSICIKPGNVFELYLSDETGNFATETLIGKYTGFYSTFVNGTIPPTTTAGIGYKMRIKTTLPASISTESTPFEIKTGGIVEAKLSSTYVKSGNTETFGSCSGVNGKVFYLKNESTIGSTTTATVTDEIYGGTIPISFPPQTYTLTAQLTHYTIFTRAVMPDGTVSTVAYFLINNDAITAFSTVGNNIVCMPTGQLKFKVTTTDLEQNFPGNTYWINWGDGASDQYTLCDIKALGTYVTHTYIKSSCGNISNTSSGTVYNAFDVSIKSTNDFCGDVGTPISSYAKVVVRPTNTFAGPPSGCTNSPITFVNNSQRGENPNTTSPGCVPNDVTYNWFVDGVIVEPNAPLSYNFVYTFTTNGEHTVRLESSSAGACDAEPFEQKICIQNPPQPKFTLSNKTICTPGTVKVTDLSIVDNTCLDANLYSWTVTPAVGYANGTNSTDKEPEFSFTAGGVYSVVLNITTASCGIISTLPDTVIVNETPTVTLSPDIVLCNLSTYDFSNTTLGPTKTIFTGTYFDLPPTYLWTVSGGTFSYENGSTPSSKYPSIKFDEYKTYTVTATQTNGCGSDTKIQTISFSTAPEVKAGADQPSCFNGASFTLAGSVNGTTTSIGWVGGSGIFNPSRSDLNAIYTPTAAEKLAGTVNLILRATTALPSPCNQIDDEIILTIKPDISLTSATTKSICTGTNVAYTPTNNVVGSTFTWTAVSSANAGGFTAIGSGPISDVLTNSDPLNDAAVTYTITPHQNGCDGTPFDFTTTITPRAQVTFTAPTSAICNKTSSVITLIPNLAGTKFTYTSAVTAGSVTGNTDNAIASTTTTINDVLTNTGSIEATVKYTITPSSATGCDGTTVDIEIKVSPSASIASAGADDEVCNATSYTLNANNPVVGTGKWTIVSAPTAISFIDTQYNTVVSGLIPGNVYELKWTVTDVNGCASTEDNVVIKINKLSDGGTTAGGATVCAGNSNGTITLSGEVGNVLRWESSPEGTTWTSIGSAGQTSISYTNLNATTHYRAVVKSGNCPDANSTETVINVNQGAVVAKVGNDQVLCGGNSTTLTGNDPLTNTGSWELIPAQAGVIITDASLYNTTVTGLVEGQTYTFKWTIAGLLPCPETSAILNVQIDLPTLGGTTTGGATVCAGNSNGTITLSGEVGNILRWESSPDGTNWTDIGFAGQPSIVYTNLNATTHYRAVVKSGVCAEASSSEAIIIVNQGAVVAKVGNDQVLCGGNSTTLTGNDPLTNIGSWALTSGQIGVNITDASSYNTTVTGLVPGQIYTFQWTISGLAPCPATTAILKVQIDIPTVGGSATGDATFCSNINTGSISLSGQVGQIVKWQSSVNGVNWIDIASTANPYAYSNISATTQFRAVVLNGSCIAETSTSSTITVNAVTVVATVGLDQNICSGSSATLTGNNPSPNTGQWTLVSGQSGVNIANATSNIATATGLIPGQNYTFRWTITGFTSCPPSFTETAVNYYPTVVNTITASAIPVCTGQNISITGNTPTGGTGIYTFQWQSSTDGVGFTDIATETNKDLSLTVLSTLYYKRLVNSSICASNSNIIQITALPPIANNTIVATQAICVGDTPAPLIGSLPTGGDGNYTYQWQSSFDGIIWVNINLETNQNLILPIPTKTILYKRIVSSASCSGAFENASNEVTVTLNPHAKAEFTYTSDKACAPFVLTATNITAVPYPDRNATYTWYADNVSIGTGANFPGYTIINDNKTVIIKLVTTSSLNCNSDEMSHGFSTPQKIVASFTQSLNGSCGPLAVGFTNTSTSLTAGTFLWNFGNGTTSNLASPPPVNFLSTNNGRDTTYTVKLTSITNCETTTATSSVFVTGKATSVFAPDKTIACLGSTITFSNFSPGGTNTYKYDFDDGSPILVVTDNQPVTHTYATFIKLDYTVKLTVENSCGSSTSSHVIRIFPDNITPILIVDPSETEGCAPLTVNFKNLTQGASSFFYDFKDGGTYSSNGGAIETISHTFNTPGEYLVTLLAKNSCFNAVPKTVVIKVYAQPTVSFTADKTVGCDGASIKFKNTSVNGISYVWDFGDGTTSDLFEPTHTYSGSGASYTVSLTAKNDLGCPKTTIMANYINIAMPPIANFTVSPGYEITLPDYTFKFNDTSIGAATGSWEWDFGDGYTSTQQNPTHTYNDVGKFNVTLKVINANGCPNMTNQEVRITGIPGYLNLPNSFMPASSKNELRTFKAKGTGIQEWTMTVFNKWGQIIWESNKLDQTEPAEGWDGTYKGVEQPQGVYYWKVEVKFINGGLWKGMTYDSSAPKKTGMIYLLR